MLLVVVIVADDSDVGDNNVGENDVGVVVRVVGVFIYLYNYDWLMVVRLVVFYIYIIYGYQSIKYRILLVI